MSTRTYTELTKDLNKVDENWLVSRGWQKVNCGSHGVRWTPKSRPNYIYNGAKLFAGDAFLLECRLVVEEEHPW